MSCDNVITVQDLETDKKHSTFYREVITGKAGGTGADIDSATNAVTGQTQATLPKVLSNVGFSPAGFDFTTGGTLTERDKAIFYQPDGNWYSWGGTLPKVVPTASSPASTGGIADNAWNVSTSAFMYRDWEGFTAELLAQAGIVDDGQPDELGNSKRVDAINAIGAKRYVSSFKNEFGYSAVDNMVAGRINGVAGAVVHRAGNVYSTGGTTWECKVDDANSEVDFAAIGDVYLSDYGADSTGNLGAAALIERASAQGSVIVDGTFYIERDLFLAPWSDLVGLGRERSKLLFDNTNCQNGIIKTVRSCISNMKMRVKRFNSPFTGVMITESIAYTMEHNPGYEDSINSASGDGVSTLIDAQSADLDKTGPTGRFLVITSKDIAGVATRVGDGGTYGIKYNNCHVRGFDVAIGLHCVIERDGDTPWIHSNRFDNFKEKSCRTLVEARVIKGAAATQKALGKFTDNIFEGWMTQGTGHLEKLAVIEGSGLRFVRCFFWDTYTAKDPNNLVTLRVSEDGLPWVKWDTGYSIYNTDGVGFAECVGVTRRQINTGLLGTKYARNAVNFAGFGVENMRHARGFVLANYVSNSYNQAFTFEIDLSRGGGYTNYYGSTTFEFPQRVAPVNRSGIYTATLGIDLTYTVATNTLVVKTLIAPIFRGDSNGSNFFIDNLVLQNGVLKGDIAFNQQIGWSPTDPLVRVNQCDFLSSQHKHRSDFIFISPNFDCASTPLSKSVNAIALFDTLEQLPPGVPVSKTLTLTPVVL